MTSGFRLGRVAGIDVYVDWSLLIIFFLITFSLAAGVFPSWHPQWSPVLSWGTALMAAVLFFASVFLHELSHALVGRRQGVEVKRITLFIFGGLAQIEGDPRVWRAELWIAVVGPITSLALGGLFLFVAGWLVGPIQVDPDKPQEAFASLGPVPTLLVWLGPVNIILGLFNLVPAFPLDGGRVLRAILWGVTGNLQRATAWASQAGQAFAWFLIITGFAMVLGVRVPIFGAGLVNGLWLAFIGWFLNNAALMSYRQLLIRETLEGVPVSKLMQTEFISVEPNVSLEALVNEHLMNSGQRAFPVTENSHFVGMVCLQDIRKVERRRWADTAVSDVMTPASRMTSVKPEEDGAEAMSILGRRGVNQLPVVANGVLKGLLRREDIVTWLSVYGQVDFDPLEGSGQSRSTGSGGATPR